MKLLKCLVCVTIILCMLTVPMIYAAEETKDAFENFSIDNSITTKSEVDEFLDSYCEVGFLEGTSGSTPTGWNSVIGFIKYGSFVGYKNIDFGDKDAEVIAIMYIDKNESNFHDNSYVEIRLDDVEGPAVATIKLPDHEDWLALGVNGEGFNPEDAALYAIEIKADAVFPVKGVHTVYYVFFNEEEQFSGYFGNIHELYFENTSSDLSPGTTEVDSTEPVTAPRRTFVNTTDSSSSDTKSGSDLTLILILGGVIVVLGGGGAVAYLLMKKNRK